MKFTLQHLFALIALCSAAGSHANAPDPDPARFAEAIEQFAAWDRKNTVPTDPVLFVGSSSIRLWATAKAFPDYPVVNRGFGGSELSDVVHYYERLIAPYAPTRIFLYEGDNDIGHGKSPEQVLQDFQQLASKVLDDFPDTELVFISIKPSKARWELWPVMQEANRLIFEFTRQHPRLGYADLASVLLGEDGLPKDVFVEDGLHLNERGYDLWGAALAPHLQ